MALRDRFLHPDVNLLADYYWILFFVALVLLAVLAARFWWGSYSCRLGGRYEYSALREDVSGERVEPASRQTSRSESNNALCNQHVPHAPSRYLVLSHLPDVGSRIDKQWYLVRDSELRTDRLLCLVPYKRRSCVTPTASSRCLLLQLFLTLRHPYLQPMLDVDFREFSDQAYVITVQPIGPAGTLKDLIYRSRWQDEWNIKYCERGEGLPCSQVQRLGRQILEALLFLYAKGFPFFAQLHSGNVIIQNGVVRLTGFENTLMGLTSRVYPTFSKRLKDDIRAIDTLCFGHVLFEMCAGYELGIAQPAASHLQDISDYPQVVGILKSIFNNSENRLPTIEEITDNQFFHHIDLREMRAMPLPQVHQPQMTPKVMQMLKDLKNLHYTKKRSKSASAVEIPVKEETLAASKNRSSTPDSEGATPSCSPVVKSSSGSSLSSSYATPPASMPQLNVENAKEELQTKQIVREHRPLRWHENDIFGPFQVNTPLDATMTTHVRARRCLAAAVSMPCNIARFPLAEVTPTGTPSTAVIPSTSAS